MSELLSLCAELIHLARSQHAALQQDDLSRFEALMEQRENIARRVTELLSEPPSGVPGVPERLAQLQVLDRQLATLLGDKLQETQRDLGQLHQGRAVAGRYLAHPSLPSEREYRA